MVRHAAASPRAWHRRGPGQRWDSAVLRHHDAGRRVCLRRLAARTAAEHLDPASFRAVAVEQNRLIPSSRLVTRPFTDPAVIARLAAFVNGLPPALELIWISCPAAIVRYTLRFTARDKNGPAVVVSDLLAVRAVAERDRAHVPVPRSVQVDPVLAEPTAPDFVSDMAGD